MIPKHRQREMFLEVAMSHLGRPYIWGGDDPIKGFDCSGLVIECLKSVGVVTDDFDTTADGLLDMFGKNQWSYPEPGCLLFTLDPEGKARHVTICLDEYFEIGASGGGRASDSADDAARMNAYVKIRPIVLSDNKVIVRLF